MSDKFENRLIELLNEHSEENTSNTPDFILAKYIIDCLRVFNTATQERERWYGRELSTKYVESVEGEWIGGKK